MGNCRERGASRDSQGNDSVPVQRCLYVDLRRLVRLVRRLAETPAGGLVGAIQALAGLGGHAADRRHQNERGEQGRSGWLSTIDGPLADEGEAIHNILGARSQKRDRGSTRDEPSNADAGVARVSARAK